MGSPLNTVANDYMSRSAREDAEADARPESNPNACSTCGGAVDEEGHTKAVPEYLPHDEPTLAGKTGMSGSPQTQSVPGKYKASE